jgi:hypothetical protein
VLVRELAQGWVPAQGSEPGWVPVQGSEPGLEQELEQESERESEPGLASP